MKQSSTKIAPNKKKVNKTRSKPTKSQKTSGINKLLPTAVLLSTSEVSKNTITYTFTRGQKIKTLDGRTEVISSNDEKLELVVKTDPKQFNLLPSLFAKMKSEVTKRSDFVTKSVSVDHHSFESIIFKYLEDKGSEYLEMIPSWNKSKIKPPVPKTQDNGPTM